MISWNDAGRWRPGRLLARTLLAGSPRLGFGLGLLCVLLVGCRGPLPVAPARGVVALWLDGEVPQSKQAEAPEQSGPRPEAGLGPLPPEEVLARRRAVREAFGRAESVGDLPEDLQAMGRARTLVARGELDAAAVELRDRIALAPKDFAARVQLGDLRIRQRLFGQAVTLLEEAARIAPGDPEGELTLAKALAARREAGDLERASALLSGLVGSDLVDRVEVAHTRVTVFHFQRDWPAAVEAAREALGKDPMDATLRLDLAQSLLLSGQPGEALGPLEPLTGSSQSVHPEALWLEAGILRRLGRFAEARARFEALLRPAFARFQEQTYPPLEVVIQQVTAEERQGQRLFYLPGEMEEILATDPAERRRLEVLHVLETGPALPAEPWPILERALADASQEVRIAALRVIGLRLLDQDRAWETLLRFLEAPEGRVRAQAALRLHRPLIDGDARVRALAGTLFTPARRGTLLGAFWAAMQTEEEGHAFESLHQALQALTGQRILLLEGEEADAEVRARLRARWKEVLEP